MRFKRQKSQMQTLARLQRSLVRRLSIEPLEDRRLLAGIPELLKDINGGPSGSSPRNFVQIGSITYFAAVDATGGNELWKTNGTSAGTVRVKDINPGAAGSYPNDLINVNGTLFFSGRDVSGGRELWKSNGTESGTVRVKDILTGVDSASPYDLINVGGTLYFSADNGSSGRELWRSNGAALGTVLVKDINPGGSSASLDYLVNVNGTLFFAANDGTTGSELWKSNGTSGGTVRVKDISAGIRGSFPYQLTNVNGTLFFSATTLDHGRELWKSNGSDAGTVLVKDIKPGGGINDNSSPTELTNVNGTLFFYATDGTSGYELWKSNGTANGTQLVKDISAGPLPSGGSNLTNLNGTLYFVANDGASGIELWKSNGTTSGTVLVKDIRPSALASSPDQLTVIDNTLYFSANDGTSGRELWKSNGTSTGTLLVKDIRLGLDASTPNYLQNVNGTLYFRANDGTSGAELWIVRPETTAPSLAIAATSANKNEGNTGLTAFTFTVTRSGSLAGATTVNYAVTGVGASPATANDFVGNVLPSGTVTFAAGQASRVITIPVRGEVAVESNETFRVRLSGASSGTTITTATANGTILNDDTSLAIAALSANKAEGNSGATAFLFTVTRSGFTSGTTTVDYAVVASGATPAQANDFVGAVFPSGQVTFAPGETTQVIRVLVRGELGVELNENFSVTLSNPSAGTTITTATANGLIRNDDAALRIAASSANKAEGNAGATAFLFTVTRSGFKSGTTTVDYAVVASGATPAQANDFVGAVFPSGQITFAPGETTQVIRVLVRGELGVELNENFSVTLSNPSVGTTITTATANGLIRNDDTTLKIAATSANKNEGNAGAIDFTFTVTRSGLLTGTTTVNYAVTGNGTNAATASDFIGNVLPSGTVTFAPGEVTKLVSIRVRGDVAQEANEGFRVTLSGASLGTSITNAVASGLIVNDDL